jgi:DtxR family Mn-dependent transcriptional regulator
VTAYGAERVLVALWSRLHEGRSGAEAGGEFDPAALREAADRGDVAASGSDWQLTEGGEARARDLIRRLRLAERLVADTVELAGEGLAIGACLATPRVAAHAVDHVCALLGHPAVCPHGHAIPRGACCERPSRAIEPLVQRLADLDPGDEARVISAAPAAAARLARLTALGLTPGALVRLIQRVPTFVLQAGETELAFEEAVAREIFVARVAARDEAAAPATRGRARGAFARLGARLLG